MKAALGAVSTMITTWLRVSAAGRPVHTYYMDRRGIIFSGAKAGYERLRHKWACGAVWSSQPSEAASLIGSQLVAKAAGRGRARTRARPWFVTTILLLSHAHTRGRCKTAPYATLDAIALDRIVFLGNSHPAVAYSGSIVFVSQPRYVWWQPPSDNDGLEKKHQIIHPPHCACRRRAPPCPAARSLASQAEDARPCPQRRHLLV